MIQVELRPDVEARLTAEAQARGVEVEAYVQTLIERAVSVRGSMAPGRPTAEEIQAFFQAMTADSGKIPQLPDEAFEHESFYQDHD